MALVLGGLAQFDAEGHQGVNFIRFVEDRVHTQLCAALTNVISGIVAQHNHFLVRFATLAGV